MRGPTRSASVIAATTSGWLMVWPKAIGSAVFSQARSAKGADTKRSRSTAAIAASTFSSAMPELPQLGDQALHGETVHRARPPAQAAANCARELAARRLVGEVEMQRRHRDVAATDGGEVALLVDLVLAAARSRSSSRCRRADRCAR